MKTYKTVEGLLADTQAEVTSLENKLQVRKEVLTALRGIIPHKREYRTRRNSGNSRISKIKGILTKAGQPMHINAIISTLGLAPTNGNKASVAGSLNNYAKRHKVFERVAPNTFHVLNS